MNDASQGLLADAGFALDQHTRIDVSRHSHLAANAFQFRDLAFQQIQAETLQRLFAKLNQALGQRHRIESRFFFREERNPSHNGKDAFLIAKGKEVDLPPLPLIA